MQMPRRLKIIFALILIASILFWLFPQKIIMEEASLDEEGGVIRFHIVANSDAPHDQALKYLVRDELIMYLQQLLNNPDLTEEEAYESISGSLGKVKIKTEEALARAGVTEKVRVIFKPIPFPTRMYGSTVFPAGEYQALKVVLGRGEGQNWWCLVFPRLCLVDAVMVVDGEKNAAGLKEKENSVPTPAGDEEKVVKFKIVDLINQWLR